MFRSWAEALEERVENSFDPSFEWMTRYCVRLSQGMLSANLQLQQRAKAQQLHNFRVKVNQCGELISYVIQSLTLRIFSVSLKSLNAAVLFGIVGYYL